MASGETVSKYRAGDRRAQVQRESVPLMWHQFSAGRGTVAPIYPTGGENQKGHARYFQLQNWGSSPGPQGCALLEEKARGVC